VLAGLTLALQLQQQSNITALFCVVDACCPSFVTFCPPFAGMTWASLLQLQSKIRAQPWQQQQASQQQQEVHLITPSFVYILLKTASLVCCGLVLISLQG
jgi:hypothetical protein